jgi:signal transduction histidine kinase
VRLARAARTYTRRMRFRLGLRSRILALTMPVVLLVSVAIAGVVYLSIGQVLEASARGVAQAEAAELRSELTRHRIEEILRADEIDIENRVAQIVDPRTGEVLATTDSDLTEPIADPTVEDGQQRLVRVDSIPGLSASSYIVDVADAVGRDGKHYSVLVGVATQAEETALGQSAEFALIGAIGLIALLGAVTTFAVGQALRPVDRLRDQVEAISSMGRDSPAQLEVPDGRDELARLAETMNRVLSRLRQADASRRAFVADAGHELRSPLATIGVLLEQLAEDRPEDQRRRIAARASAEVDRLALLVDDLLTLASADERAMVLDTTEVDLDDVVLAETGALRTRGMPVAVTVEPLRVVGDVARLGRVVRNLLENAERHMHSHVRVTLRGEGEDAVLEVDNDGPPIAPEDRDRVFSRFVRLDDSRTRGTGGTGLGLAIVAEVTAAHGGSVVATETDEGWCRFVVRIPRDPEPG